MKYLFHHKIFSNTTFRLKFFILRAFWGLYISIWHLCYSAWSYAKFGIDLSSYQTSFLVKRKLYFSMRLSFSSICYSSGRFIPEASVVSTVYAAHSTCSVSISWINDFPMDHMFFENRYCALFISISHSDWKKLSNRNCYRLNSILGLLTLPPGFLKYLANPRTICHFFFPKRLEYFIYAKSYSRIWRYNCKQDKPHVCWSAGDSHVANKSTSPCQKNKVFLNTWTQSSVTPAWNPGMIRGFSLYLASSVIWQNVKLPPLDDGANDDGGDEEGDCTVLLLFKFKAILQIQALILPFGITKIAF